MANFSIRLVKRDCLGNPVHGQWVEFETDSGVELAEFYEKITIGSRPGKRHSQVAGKQTKQKRRGERNGKNIPVSSGVEGE